MDRAPTWHQLSATARLLVIAAAGAGLGVAGWQLAGLDSAALDGAALLFMLLALAAGSITVRLPLIRASFSLDTLFVLALLLHGATGAAVLVSGLAMVLGELRSTERHAGMWHTLPYNFGVGVLSAAAALGAMALAAAWLPAGGVVARTGAAALGYWAANVALVAAAVSATRGAPLRAVLGALSWTAPAFLGAGCLAALLLLVLAEAPLAGLLTIPLMVVLYAVVVATREKQEGDRRHAEDVEQRLLPTVAAITAAIEARNAADGGHHARVQALALALAEELGVDDQRTLTAVRFGALLHDVGRIALPDSLLLEPGPLTASQRRAIEMHPVLGAELIRHVPFDAPVAETIRHHHERWDGGGYPEGLAGEACPLPARLTAVAEVVDTLLSPAPQGRALSGEQAVDEARRSAGTQLDPAIVAVLPAALQRVAAAAAAHDGEPHTAFHAISEGALKQALELGLARNLDGATDLGAALQAVAATCADALAVDGWALLTGAPGADGLRLSSPDMGKVARAVGNPWPDGTPYLDDDPEPSVIRLEGELAGQVAIAMPLGHGAWYGTLLARCPRTDGELLRATTLLPALATPLAAGLARVARAEQREREATTDALTGLSNRLAMDRFLEAVAADEGPAGEALGVLLLDLDGFKGLNDHFGHHLGDDALVEVGRGLAEVVEGREGVRAFRQGGDEFAVLLDGRAAGSIGALAPAVRDRIEAVELEVAPGEFLRLQTSVGPAVGAAGDAEALFQRADEAMYADKQARPDRLPRGARPRTYRKDRAEGIIDERDGRTAAGVDDPVQHAVVVWRPEEGRHP